MRTCKCVTMFATLTAQILLILAIRHVRDAIPLILHDLDASEHSRPQCVGAWLGTFDSRPPAMPSKRGWGHSIR